MHAEKKDEEGLLHVFVIGFLAPLLKVKKKENMSIVCMAKFDIVLAEITPLSEFNIA